jgi:hypothetical protein
MKIAILFTTILLTAGVHAAQPAAPVTPGAAKAAPQAAPKPQFQEVPYDELGKYLNKRVVVRTTLRTERSGILTKYTGTAIDLKLDTGATLSMPRDTIKNAGVAIAPPDPLYPDKK